MPATKDEHSTGRRKGTHVSGRWMDLWEAAELLGSGVSEGTPVANETELLAWVVLRAANRAQAKGSTARLVVPSAPEVAYEVGVELPEARLLEVEEYLQDRGYIEPVDIGLTRGSYTITPAGLEYLDMGASEPLEAPREEVTEASEGAERRPATGGTREDTEKRPQEWIPRRFQLELIEARKQLEEERSEERGWWRRMFRG
jgi:DNA-binding PadR family transcriptional regulator